MPVVPVIIKPLTAFRYGQVIIVPFCRPHVKKISSSFPGTESFTINTLQFPIVMLVLHVFPFLVNQKFLYKQIYVCF